MHRGFWDNLKKPIIGLAPMDGVSDAPFRYITAKYGQPSVLITEFTNVEALAHGAVKALTAFLYSEIERPIVAQIYGVNPEAFYKACFVACELGFDGIDINMGCPSKSVSGNGGGAGLIRTPMLAQEIILACQTAIKDWAEGKTLYEAAVHPDIIDYIEKTQAGSSPDTFNSPARPHQNQRSHTANHRPAFQPQRRLLPLSVKTRIGYDKIVTQEWLKYLLEFQLANISLHGRTLKQMYTGLANWEEIAQAAQLIHQESPQTTILGNGDIKSLAEAHQKIAEYGVDGVLIGRGAFGEPWIFKGEKHTIEEKLAIAIEHAKTHEAIFGDHEKAFAPMKKHLGWYCTDFPNAKELRLQLMAAKSSAEVETIVKNAENKISQNPSEDSIQKN